MFGIHRQDFIQRTDLCGHDRHQRVHQSQLFNRVCPGRKHIPFFNHIIDMILHDFVPNLRVTLSHIRDNLLKLIFVVMLVQFAIQHELTPRRTTGPLTPTELLFNRPRNMRHAGDGFACPCPECATTILKDGDTPDAIELWLHEGGVDYLAPMLTELLCQHHFSTALDELRIDGARLRISQDTHIPGLELLLPLRLRFRTGLCHRRCGI